MGCRCTAGIAALLAVLICGCGGPDGLKELTPLDPGPAGPAVLPTFPAGDADTPAPGAPRIVAFTDTSVLGKDTWKRSPGGARNNGDALDLTSTATEIAWGIWRWPNFIPGIKPQTIELNVTPGSGSTFWLLFADYTLHRWEVHGPLDGTITTFTFDQAKDYISNNGQAVYVALVAEGGAALEADQLTLSATDLPAPTNLAAANVRSTSAHLSWKAIDSPVALGYQIYTGPAPDFNIGDPGVDLQGPQLITTNTYNLTGLFSDTHYYWRVRAYFGAWGPLSSTAEFTTPASLPPAPVITMDNPVQQNAVISLDSWETTDPDTPLDEIVFSWDFENDGTVDEETTGPQTVFHTYTDRGPYTVKLTAFDGQNVTVTRDIEVSFRYRYEITTIPEGDPQAVLACDADPGSGRVVLLMTDGIARYFDGSSWETVALAFSGYQNFLDVALTSASFATLGETFVGGSDNPTYNWGAMEYAAGGWTEHASGTRSGNLVLAGKLAVAPSGRVSTAMISASEFEGSYTGSLYVTHEKADGSTASNSVGLDNNKFQACDLVRGDETTWVVYCKASATHVWSIDDGGNSDVQSQTYVGDAGTMALGMDPEDPAHIFWATGNGTDAIYYGDNYGAANGAGQVLDGGDGAISVAAVGLAGDNEVHVFWTSRDTDETERLRGFDSVAGGGQTYDIVEGLGAAAGGVGAFYPLDSATEVYLVANETRDGECIARVIRNGAVQSTIQASPPTGNGQLTDAAGAVAFGDNSFLCLASQGFPSCLTTQAGSPDGALSAGQIGQDTYCIADCAAALPGGGGFIVGSYTERGRLQLNRFDLGNPVGAETAYLAGTSKAQLVTSRNVSELRLFYLANAAMGIEERLWNGSGWSDPGEVYSGPATIEAFSAATSADGLGWGVALLDNADKVQLVENSGGSWGSPQLLSSNPVAGGCGIGLDYCLADPDKGLVVAVAREGGSGGVFAGFKPAGGAVAWEQVDHTSSTEVQSLCAFWHMANPLVVYHHAEYPFSASRLRFYEKLPGSWFLTEPALELHSEPLARAVLPAGHMLFTGYEDSHYPRQMVVAEFYP